MYYHNITYDDMLNGSGLRVVLWCSGCNHNCHNCQNSQTWDINSGIPFDKKAKREIFEELSKDYISGITFSGGDPLHENNLNTVLDLINEIRLSFPTKTIWLYSGYTWEQVMNPVLTGDFNTKRDEIIKVRQDIVKQCDIFVDGRYVDELRGVTLHWTGSSNQRVIDVKKTLQSKEIVLYDE